MNAEGADEVLSECVLSKRTSMPQTQGDWQSLPLVSVGMLTEHTEGVAPSYFLQDVSSSRQRLPLTEP